MPARKPHLLAIPQKPGVYFFKGKRGEILYIGKAKSLRRRVVSYFTKQPDIKTSILLGRLSDISYITTDTELGALILEDELIKKYKPRYNISLRDDKAYPFLKLTVNEKWPRLFLVRRRQEDGARYFGRFQGGLVREIIRLTKKLFPIRWCKESPLRLRKQPCLYYRIGSCSGPCIGKVRPKDYRGLVQGIISLLKGKMDQAVTELEREMKKAAARQDFEAAASLRDRVGLLKKMIEGKELHKAPSPRLLFEISELQKKLKLKNAPMRIEAFDVSNISGTNIVGAMVAFYGGLPLKRDYRKFKIKSVEKKANDVAAIYEVVKRRYTGSLSSKLAQPDLVMVDGGITQLGAAARALADSALATMPVIGLAKREEKIYTAKNKRPLLLPKTSPALNLLQRIRDEAHRFAVTYHRQKRRRSLFAS